MADLYFGYAERNASDEINWAEIGKNVTDMLKQENSIREQKRAAIDAATRRDGEILANAPQGEHQGINQWALTYADNAQKARLLQDRLLKSGQLKPKDYFVMRQNLVDGTAQAFNLIKEYQSEYKSRMESFQKKETSLFDVDLLAEVEGFGNFNESELYINPTNFEVNIAKKKKEIIDGKEVYVMSKDPNDFTTVNAMRNRIKGKFNRLDVAKTLQDGVDRLGKDVVTLVDTIATTKGGGLLKTTKDIVQRPDFGVETNNAISLFERAENTYLDSILSIADDTMSILYDYVGQDPKNKKPYTYTWNDKEAGGNVILLKNSPSGRPVPQFTDEQKEVAKDALREKFRIMLDREIELRPTPQVQELRPPTPAEIGQGNLRKQAENYARNLSMLLTGTDDQAEAALAYFNGLGVNMNRGKNVINVTEVDKDNNPIGVIPYKFGTNTADNIASSLIGGANPYNIPEEMIMDYVKKFNRGKKINFNVEAVGKTMPSIQSEQDPLSIYSQYVETKISPDLIKDKTKSEAAAELNKSLLGLGITVKPSQWINDKIFVVNKDGLESPLYDIVADPEGAIESIKEWIKLNPSGGTERGKKKFIQTLQSTGVLPKSGGAGELD